IAFLERRDGGPEHPDSDFLGHARRRPYDAAAPDNQHRRGWELDGRVNWSASRKKTGCQEFQANSRTMIRLTVFTICAGTRRKWLTTCGTLVPGVVSSGPGVARAS